MQQYPTIVGSAKAPLGKPCIAFYKYDGSNLRWEWTPKKSWHKYGTRHQLFDGSDPVFGKAISIFGQVLCDEIVNRLRKKYKDIQRITAFTEYFGPNSFAGKHDPTDKMELRLIDIYLYKKGLMNPNEFVKMFGDLDCCAEVIYQGNLNKEFIKDVKEGWYPVNEGVVAKGEWGMAKIKTNAYFKRLNEVYGTEYRQYWE